MEQNLTLSFFDSPSKLTQRYIFKNFPILFEKIKDNPGRSIAEKLYIYFNNIDKLPLCDNCGIVPKKFLSISKGYSQYCCNHCSVTDKKRVQKAKNTMIERYGVEYAAQSKEIQEKTRTTNLERYGGTGFESKSLVEKTKATNLARYGVEWTTQSKEIQEKAKVTNLERYGVEYPTQSKEIQEKAKVTNLERYGVEYPTQSKEIQEKAKVTNLERYGSHHPMQNKKIKEKVKQIFMENYGVDNPQKSKEIQEKTKATNLERYGVEYVMQDKHISMVNKKSRLRYIVESHDFIKDIDNDGNWICKCPHPDCNKCDGSYVISSSQYYARKEFGCEPCTNILSIDKFKGAGTSPELFVRNILDEYNISYETNNRKILCGKELDIYIPDRKLAIECNGVYWHSLKETEYHYEKWKGCADKGIQLLSIWEDWVKIKPEIIKSIILSKLGIYQQRIYARQCDIKEVPLKESLVFLQLNHIQGICHPSIRLGLYNNNELVGIMCFSKRSGLSGSKIIRKNEYELTRFCTILNTNVIGGASKLLKYFITNYNPKSIVSFSCNDISNGNLYQKLGFNKESLSISYWYVSKRTYERFHRSRFSKSEIRRNELIPDEFVNKNWTENDVTQSLGLLKIFDSGKIKWVYEL